MEWTHQRDVQLYLLIAYRGIQRAAKVVERLLQGFCRSIGRLVILLMKLEFYLFTLTIHIKQ